MYKYESENVNFDDKQVECWTRDWHDFLNLACQRVEVIKARKMVVKSVKLQHTTLKTPVKTFTYLIMKDIWIESTNDRVMSHCIFAVFSDTAA